jgi:hypothetical protein
MIKALAVQVFQVLNDTGLLRQWPPIDGVWQKVS